jgi:hypothetical protein
MPFGRVHDSVTAPTGSGSARTTSQPAAMASMRLRSSARRSTNAAVAPCAFASATSSALAARMSSARATMFFAMAASAASFVALGARASVRAASRARRPISRMVRATSASPSIDFSGAVMGGI